MQVLIYSIFNVVPMNFQKILIQEYRYIGDKFLKLKLNYKIILKYLKKLTRLMNAFSKL